MDKPPSDIKLRPHHILCIRFLKIEFPDRGEAFERIYREMIAMLISDEEAVIEVACGSDDICKYCSYFGEGWCINPLGDEDKVRRWDLRIMEGLGLNYGDKKTSGEFKKLISNKAPLDFCKSRCPWKSICTVFGNT